MDILLLYLRRHKKEGPLLNVRYQQALPLNPSMTLLIKFNWGSESKC